MNTIKLQPFPTWWVRTKCNRINNLLRESQIENIPIIRRNETYRWSHTYNRCRNKLAYRYKDYYNFILKDKEKWDVYLSYEINKLYQRYDEVYLWGVCEFDNCEKINRDDFGSEKVESLIWRFKGIEEAGDLNKRMKSERKKQERTDACNWETVIGMANVRFSRKKKKKNPFIDDELWHYCYRANKDKINKWVSYVSWGSRISQNLRKIEGLFSEE